MAKNHQKNSFLSSGNRLSDYITINKSDGFLAEYVDYLGFYGDYDHSLYLKLYKSFTLSDNSGSFSYGPFHLSYDRGFIFIYYSHLGQVVNLSRLSFITVSNSQTLKVDIYGKGLLVLNRDKQRSYLISFLASLGLHDIMITRYDHAVDCRNVRRRKQNRLNSKIQGQIKTKDGIEYKTFGRKNKSAHFLRYYDKKNELIKRQTLNLYPEYYYIDTIIRYELVTLSDGMDQSDRVRNIYDIESLANFGQTIQKIHRQAKQRKTLYTGLEHIAEEFRKLKKQKNIKQILTIKNMYNSFFYDIINDNGGGID